METIRLGLFNAHQAHQCLMEVWMAIKPLLVLASACIWRFARRSAAIQPGIG